MKQRIVAFAVSKQRTAFGMVGVDIDDRQKQVNIGLAKLWKREELNSIPDDLISMTQILKQKRFEANKTPLDKGLWNEVLADQRVGQALIRKMETAIQSGIKTLVTQKNVNNVENIALRDPLGPYHGATCR